MEAAGGDLAEVEETADETVESGCLGIDHARRIAPSLVGPRDLGIGEAAGGRPDACQRRAEVVRDRVDERGLQHIRLMGDLEVRGRLSELIAPERHRDLVGGEREDARLAPGWVAQLAVAQRDDGPERHVVDLDPGAVLQVVGRRWGGQPDRVEWVRTQRAGSSPGVRTRLEVRLGWGRRLGAPRAVSCVGEDPFGGAGPGDDPHAIERRRIPHALRDVRCGFRGRGRRGERPAEREERVGLGGPLGGLLCSCVLDGDETADDEPDEQEQDEVEHLAWIGDGDAEPWLGEEDVVGEERRERGHDRRDGACEGSRRDDGDEVDGRRVLDPEEVPLEDGDHERRKHEGTDHRERGERGARARRGEATCRARQSYRRGHPHAPDGRTRSSLVLAGRPKYGLEQQAPHPYCLAHSGPVPTPEYPRGPEPPRSAQNEAT